MADNEECEESGISMVEVLQEEEEREMNAAAVLGPASDTQCTYDEGYKKRQALYACMTCCPADGEHMGGVCLACSYHCHEDHDLVELYTKRDFRCDCGNSKFPQNTCKLLKDKNTENSGNKYNHNFRGVYCTCNRPYPDPEDPDEDEMIQCCLCEDWYHGKHQGGNVPQDDQYGDMICTECLPKHKFLSYIVGLAVTPLEEEETKTKNETEISPTKNAQVNVEEKEEEKAKENTDASFSNSNTKDDVKDTEDKEDEEKDEGCQSSESPTECGGDDGGGDGDEINAGKGKESECKLVRMSKQPLPKGALFLPAGWRKQLCVCESCKCTYKAEGVLYLLDDEDTVKFYEDSGRSRQGSSSAPVERELEALSSLDRVVRTEMVHEYNNLSSSLRDYLRKFAESKKVVRDEDIREFFSQLAANKKQKPNSGVQLFCR